MCLMSIALNFSSKGGKRIDVKALYEALAKVIGQRENVEIKITVERDERDEKNS